MSWNPKTHPYRVTWNARKGRRSSEWSDFTKHFQSFAEAKAALEAFFAEGIAFASMEVVEGVIPDACHWALLGTRKRKHPTQLTSTGREHERAVTA